MENIKEQIKRSLSNMYIMWLKSKGIKIGSHVFINGRMMICGTKNVTIDDDVFINSKLKANPIGGNTHCMFKTAWGGEFQ